MRSVPTISRTNWSCGAALKNAMSRSGGIGRAYQACAENVAACLWSRVMREGQVGAIGAKHAGGTMSSRLVM